ncbi:Smad nuclear-interacting protein 1 [Borealophlyctis nickersoniae]|nr:Smad nuclear-interacting protein 1 [Borealophlyctis nickersoniae]
MVTDPNAVGPSGKRIKPYLIDLESTNGTYVNGERIPSSRYYEVKVGDAIKFGYSSREYVMMSEDMADDTNAEEENS